MVFKTRAIVLRTVKYGETSIIATLFTEQFGVLPFLVKGIRKTGKTGTKAALFQPGTSLETIIQYQHARNFQYLKEFALAAPGSEIDSDMVKKSISIFCIEILLRLLPTDAPAPELFNYAFDFMTGLKHFTGSILANAPLYFTLNCSRYMGYDVNGAYSIETPFLNITEGGFSDKPQHEPPILIDDECRMMYKVIQDLENEAATFTDLNRVMRNNLLNWIIVYLQSHTRHMGPVRSLSVLHEVLA